MLGGTVFHKIFVVVRIEGVHVKAKSLKERYMVVEDD
jgi:hypothetical protein